MPFDLAATADFRQWLRPNIQRLRRFFKGLQSGGPLLALRHLVELLVDDPHNPPLRAGEIISTGTLTLAMPVRADETWTTTVRGIPLENVTLRLET
ncbi:MAG: hypothetical protein KGK33_05860 [Hyphomicrobiales bacterium]|nr:hypothetical protein [Hyphomicrobiales bacterium]